MPPTARDDVMGTKRKIKMGFKSDRAAKYKAKIESARGQRAAPDPKKETPHRMKSLVFDSDARRKELLSAHKAKNERRVKAMTEAKRKMRKEASKLRRELREEARQQYNTYATVPILPDYSYRFPHEQGDEEAAEQLDEPVDERVYDIADGI